MNTDQGRCEGILQQVLSVTHPVCLCDHCLLGGCFIFHSLTHSNSLSLSPDEQRKRIEEKRDSERQRKKRKWWVVVVRGVGVGGHIKSRGGIEQCKGPGASSAYLNAVRCVDAVQLFKDKNNICEVILQEMKAAGLTAWSDSDEDKQHDGGVMRPKVHKLHQKIKRD